MAYAAALFADACLRGLNGAVATECTYVESPVIPDVPFFATKVKLGTEGGWWQGGGGHDGSVRW
jgi:malate dehydrogenase